MLRAKWKIFRKFFYISVAVVVAAALHIYLLCEKTRKSKIVEGKRERDRSRERGNRAGRRTDGGGGMLCCLVLVQYHFGFVVAAYYAFLLFSRQQQQQQVRFFGKHFRAKYFVYVFLSHT